MQKGSLIRRARHSQSEVWEFRWREPGPTGTRRHRRVVVGPTDQIANESAARQAVAALQIEINPNRKSARPAITIGDLVQHFRQRELRSEFAWRTFSTRNSYEGNLRKWILPDVIRQLAANVDLLRGSSVISASRHRLSASSRRTGTSAPPRGMVDKPEPRYSSSASA
jgi:hypothetical protein